MKDFDTARQARKDKDRMFRLGGETFFMRSGVRPEVFAGYDDMTADTPSNEALKMIDQIVLDMIESRDGAHDRYRTLRLQEDDPITLEDLTALVEWLIGEQTGRPTQQPSPSTPGPENTGTTSTDDSSLPEALEVAPTS